MTRLVVPAGEGRAIRVAAGGRFTVVDLSLEGGQVGDLFAFNAHELTEYASAEHTRPAIGRLFPEPGQQILSNRRESILELVADTSPGRHDTLYAACDPARYRLLGVVEGHHRSCAENLREAMGGLGFADVAVPQPLNVFMDVRVDASGRIVLRPASSKPGDHLVFKALLDCYVVLSSCPMDINEISSGGVTALALDLAD